MFEIITQDYVQGDWWWCSNEGEYKDKINVTDNVFEMGAMHCDFFVTENAFGFKEGNLEVIFRPESVKFGLIKVYSPSDELYIWVRKFTQDV